MGAVGFRRPRNHPKPPIASYVHREATRRMSGSVLTSFTTGLRVSIISRSRKRSRISRLSPMLRGITPVTRGRQDEGARADERARRCKKPVPPFFRTTAFTQSPERDRADRGAAGSGRDRCRRAVCTTGRLSRRGRAPCCRHMPAHVNFGHQLFSAGPLRLEPGGRHQARPSGVVDSDPKHRRYATSQARGCRTRRSTRRCLFALDGHGPSPHPGER